MVYTVIDMEIVNESLNNLDSSILTFDANRLIAKNTLFFQKMQEAGLDNGFINSYDENNDKLISTLQVSKQTLLSILKNMEELDQNVRDEISSLLEDNNHSGSGGSSSSSGFADYSSTPTVDQLIDNSKSQLEQYANMSMSDLQVVANELLKLADENNTTLDKILSGEDYTLKIHSRLLACPNLSESLKTLIEQGNTDISQKTLANIFSGSSPEIIGLNDKTINVVRAYLTMVARNNNISLQQLLNDNSYSSVLKNSLGNFKNIPTYLNSENDQSIKDMLFDVYDGNNISNLNSSEVSIIREFIDTSAQTNNSNVETYLNNNTNISNHDNDFGKSSIFLNSLTKFSDATISNILNVLINIK